MNFELEKLQSISLLKGLPLETITWLAEHGTKLSLNTGDRMFNRGEPSDHMFIVVSGAIQRYEEIAGQWLLVATTCQGEVTGILPFSRMTHYPGHGIATEPTEVLKIHKSDFIELLTISHELGQRLVAEMSQRVRQNVRFEQHRDKMIALGRLSAGLAHELNNPAAAIRSTSDYLATCQKKLRELNMRFARHGLEDTIIEAMNQLRETAIKGKGTKYQTILMRSSREEELNNWLEKKNVSMYWDLAAAFTDAGISTQDLEKFSETFPQDLLDDAFTWVAESVAIDNMIGEIKDSAGRISNLVDSVKAYSNMDRSPEHKQIDVCKGLDDTIIMFQHRLNGKSIRLKREYDQNTHKIDGNIGELNQVWTNIIENALDAMDDNGELIIKTENNKWGVIVRILDDGCGILEELLESVFDPFVTTKGVGEGTGLGLNISRRIVATHGGQIEILRRTKGTEVCVRLPFKSELREKLV